MHSAVTDILQRFAIQRIILVADLGLLPLVMLSRLQNLKVKDRSMEFIMYVLGRRYGEFE